MDSSSKPFNNPLSIFTNFQLNFPFFNNNSSSSTKPTPKDAPTDKPTPKPDSVRMVDVAPITPPSLHLQAEEPTGRTSNPVVLWQVYAVGGFLVLRWVWARWKERKERSGKESSDDNNQDQNPADNNDHEST